MWGYTWVICLRCFHVLPEFLALWMLLGYVSFPILFPHYWILVNRPILGSWTSRETSPSADKDWKDVWVFHWDGQFIRYIKTMSVFIAAQNCCHCAVAMSVWPLSMVLIHVCYQWSGLHYACAWFGCLFFVWPHCPSTASAYLTCLC